MVTQDNPSNASAADDRDRPSGDPETADQQAMQEQSETNRAAEAGDIDEAAQQPGELETITAERNKLREQLLRTAADFDNFRKRSKRDIDEARQRGKDDLVRELLPVFDNLERAVHTADSASDSKSVLDGVRMVLKLFEDTAERMGLARVPTVGERFDPAVHEAIQQQETDAQPPGTIVAEVVPGYRFGQRLVRPAMVVVARKPSEPKPKPEAEPNEAKPNGAAGAENARDAGTGASAAPASQSQRPTSSAPSSSTEGGDEPKMERDPESTE